MGSEHLQGHQGLFGNNCAVPSSAHCPAGSALVPQVPLPHQFHPGPGVFPPEPPQGSIPQASPYQGLISASDLRDLHQLHQSQSGYTIPPGPPSHGGIVPVRTQPSSSRGRQQSVPAVRPQSPTSNQRSSSTRQKRK